MAININVNGTLTPVTVDDPTHFDLWGKGGFKAVSGPAEMYNIPQDLLTYGCWAYDLFNRDIFVWDGSSWDKVYIESANIADGAIQTNHLGTSVGLTFQYKPSSSVPGTSGESGSFGDWALNSTHLYLCVASSDWRRITLETF